MNLVRWIKALVVRGHPPMSHSGRTWFPDPETVELEQARSVNRRTREATEQVLKDVGEYKHFLEMALLKLDSPNNNHERARPERPRS